MQPRRHEDTKIIRRDFATSWQRRLNVLRSQRLHHRPRSPEAADPHRRAGEPRSRDRGRHGSRVQVRRRRSGAAVREAGGLQHAGGVERLRLPRTHVPGARRQHPRRSRPRDRGADDASDAQGHHGRAQAHAAGQPAERPDAEDRVGRAVPGNRAAGRHARRAADPHVLARGRRAVHHAAARLHEGSRNRDAQHRHLPDAGVRRADHRHALAAAQGRRAASSGRGAAGPAARGGGRAQPGARAHVLRDGADAGRPRRAAARRVPRQEAHRDGQVRHRRSRGARERAHRARRATSSPASAAARAPSATTRGSTRSPTTTRCFT